MNTHEGTLAVWANASTTVDPAAMMYFESVAGRGLSHVSIEASTPSNSECFTGMFGNSSGSSFIAPSTPSACGYAANTWHRIVLTWSAGKMTFFIDGSNSRIR